MLSIVSPEYFIFIVPILFFNFIETVPLLSFVPEILSILSLLLIADNALTVESGRINKDNSLSVPKSSTNSCALDENGKRRIAVPDIFDGDSIDMYSTSFATPIVLANELKKQR